MNEELVNPYAAPSHDRLEVAAAESEHFYVVSPTKFCVLYLATLGLYTLYWDYKQWALIKRTTHGSEWPVPRAIFNIFFQHSLNAEIDQRLHRQGIAFDWSPNGRATAIVFVLLVHSVSGRISDTELGGTWALAIMLACIPVLTWLRLKVQRAANTACGDPLGRSNSSFGAANIIWIVLGSLFWLLVLIGLFMPAEA